MTYDPDNPGGFDDLLGIRERAAERATARRQAIGDLLTQALARLDPAAPPEPAPRPRQCSRCCSVADAAERRGQPQPPVREAESWVHEGRRYWAATCAPCTDYEWSELWQRRYNLAVKAANTTVQRALVAVVNARVASGRRFLGTTDVAATRAAT